MDTPSGMESNKSNSTQSNNLELEVKPVTKPKKTRRLTAKQEAFVKEYLETKNGAEAARRVYKVANDNVANVIASENLSKPNLQAAITGLQQQFVEDSSNIYAKQKEIFYKASEHSKHWELANKIGNKILDRAGFAPTHKSESKNMTAKFVITRGDDTDVIPTTNTPVIEE